MSHIIESYLSLLAINALSDQMTLFNPPLIPRELYRPSYPQDNLKKPQVLFSRVMNVWVHQKVIQWLIIDDHVLW